MSNADRIRGWFARGRRRPRGRASGLLPVLLLVALPLRAIPASAAAPTCLGMAATIVGTPEDDVLAGTRGPDVIVGLGGADEIDGRGGEDVLCGGGGDDVVIGGRGSDRLHGGGGGDVLIPGPGEDLVDGGGSRFDVVDLMAARGPVIVDLAAGAATGQGTDTLARVEQAAGGAFDDVLRGDDGPNWLIGMGGDDALYGLGDDDDLSPGPGDDLVDGGDGWDFDDHHIFNAFILGQPLAGPVAVNLAAGTATGEGSDVLVSIEGASGSLGDDTMIGDAQDNVFMDLAEGDDTVAAGAGDDLVDGGEGADHLDGGPGDDLLGYIQSPVGVTVDLGAGTASDGDVLAGFEDLFGSFEDDTLVGDGGPNLIAGLPGDDTIVGGAGDDELYGDEDEDRADGGLGTDTCDAEVETACESDPPPFARAAGARSAAQTDDTLSARALPSTWAVLAETWTEPVDETIVDVGCEVEVTIHVSGYLLVHLTEGPGGWFVYHVTPVLQQTWVEDGETFLGPVSGPFTARGLPSDGFSVTDVFTAVANGDQGTHALFRYRAQLTLTPSGDVAADFERFSGRCW